MSQFRVTTPFGPPVHVEEERARHERRRDALRSAPPRRSSISAEYPEFFDYDDNPELYADDRLSPAAKWLFSILAAAGVCMVALATAQPARHIFLPPPLAEETPTLAVAQPDWELPARVSTALSMRAWQNLDAERRSMSLQVLPAAVRPPESSSTESRATDAQSMESRESRMPTEPTATSTVPSSATPIDSSDLRSTPPESTSVSPPAATAPNLYPTPEAPAMPSDSATNAPPAAPSPSESRPDLDNPY